jgi:YD repeat-containing protein
MLCDCNGLRIPTKWKMTVSGITNGTCSDCTSLNGDYYPERLGTSCSVYEVAIAGSPCGFNIVRITLTYDTYADTILMVIGFGPGYALTISNASQHDLWVETWTPSRTVFSPPGCTFPDTIMLEPMPPAISGLAAATCVAPPVEPTPPVYVGPIGGPNECPPMAVPSALSAAGIMGTASLGAGSGQLMSASQSSFGPQMGYITPPGIPWRTPTPIGPAPPGPPLRTPTPISGPPAGPPSRTPTPICTGSSCGCPPAQSGGNGSGQMIGTFSGPGAINLSTGSVLVQLGAPLAGALDPSLILTYNSRNTTAGEFGRGFTTSYSAKITEIDSTTVQMKTALGDTVYYREKDTNGVYIPPPGGNKLVKNSGDSTWTETLPSGDQIHYDSAGKMDYLVNVASARWTLGYDGGSRLQTIQSPANKTTTIGYDGSNKIQTVRDPSGRTTTLTVDGSSNLTQHTTPELCITELHYTSNKLDAYIDPLGYRTTFGYDANGLPNSMIRPSGDRTTITWSDWSTGKIQEASGAVTTLTFNVARNITAVQNPLGQRATLSWELDQLTSYVDPLGNQTTFSYEWDSGKRAKRISSVQNPLGARQTYTYDSGNKLQAHVDESGARTTLVWNVSGQREGIVNPLGNRTTYSYGTYGLASATLDPLGARHTLGYTSSGQCQAVQNPLGYVTTLAHSAYGQVESMQNPLGQVTTFTRDLMNRVTAEQNSLGQRTSFTYDLNGWPTAVQMPALSRRWCTTPGACGSAVDALGNRTTNTLTPSETSWRSPTAGL